MTPKLYQTRILFVEAGAGAGGSSMFLYSMLKYLNYEKFKAFVAFYSANSGPDTTKIQSLGVPVYFLTKKQEPFGYRVIRRLSVKSRWCFLHKMKVFFRMFLQGLLIEIPRFLKAVMILKKESIDLVVLNNDVHYHLVPTLAARLTGIPCICRKAGGIGEGKRIKKLLTPCVGLYIAVSKATNSDQLKNNPATRRLVTVYEGVDLKSFVMSSANPQLFHELGIPSHKKVVGQIARLDKGKGQAEFIEAAYMVQKKYKDVVFLIVGDDMDPQREMFNRLRDIAANLNLKDTIIFSGWRDDIHAILSIIDIFVHCPTTWIEGLGIANLEAMAMGKPTVVSNNGGLPDAVLDGVTGFVVPAGDSEKMAEAILTLLRNEDLAARLGINARRRAEQEFDIEKNTRVLESYFKEYALNR